MDCHIQRLSLSLSLPVRVGGSLLVCVPLPVLLQRLQLWDSASSAECQPSLWISRASFAGGKVLEYALELQLEDHGFFVMA